MIKQLRLAPFFMFLFLGFSLLTTFQMQAQATPNDLDDSYFSAVWVSSVFNLDYPTSPTRDAATLRAEADKILDDVQDLGLTAIFLQVRPSADSLFPSDYFPWSKYLTGTQGVPPLDNFDPLAYFIEGAHERGIELHAWINPYRITKNGEPEFENLTEDHPAKQHPEYVVEYNGNYYFDPGNPAVQELLVNSILEIVNNYDVDGVHFDDYFYPGEFFADEASYAQYGGDLTLDDFRRENVNTFVRTVSNAIQEADDSVSFGISPFGIWGNRSDLPEGSNTSGLQSYSEHYADSKKWVKEGWIDYITPQIYWEIGHPAADYKTLVNWWSDVVEGTGVDLYTGLASYKSANVTNPSDVWYGTNAISEQLALNDTLPNVVGEVYFRYGLLKNTPGLMDLIKNRYAKSESPQEPLPTAEETVSPSKFSIFLPSVILASAVLLLARILKGPKK